MGALLHRGLLSGRVGKRRGPGLLGVSSKRRDTQAGKRDKGGRRAYEQGGKEGRNIACGPTGTGKERKSVAFLRVFRVVQLRLAGLGTVCVACSVGSGVALVHFGSVAGGGSRGSAASLLRERPLERTPFFRRPSWTALRGVGCVVSPGDAIYACRLAVVK